jgi:hypothetical protein
MGLGKPVGQDSETVTVGQSLSHCLTVLLLVYDSKDAAEFSLAYGLSASS